MYKCNGCEDDLAKKVGADIAFIGTVRKASDVLFTVSIYVRDVANQKVIRQGSSEIYGNTDKMWLRAVNYIVDRRLYRPGRGEMIDRRRVLLAGGAAALASFGLPMHRAAAAGELRVASLKFGSLSWLLETMRAEGLAEKAGVNVVVVEVATNQAGPVALLSGEADVIVSDWPWALRQRAMGEHVKFAPYSSALGAVMVAQNSPIKKLADLKGKKLGVAGGAIDKSWLLLRAYSQKGARDRHRRVGVAVVRRRAAAHRRDALRAPRRGAQFLDLRGAPRRRQLPHRHRHG